ncbi:MAG: HXXEE domain-containing protein [Tannerellaceae bacterium]|nr:HXXEE domain-containing protein [Tannerellaceae bacterium]
MNFYRRNWYYIGGVLFVTLSYYMGFIGIHHMSHIQVILTYSFMAMLVHQFEEYGMPGGFPSIFNIAFSGQKKDVDRYPLNANTAMINNVFMTYPFYILAIISPGAIWYGLIQVGQGMVQILNHGYWNNKKLKTWYNPGLASVIFLHWPIGIYYIWYVSTNHLATVTDYIIGFIGSWLTMLVLWLGPVMLLRNRKSRYPFTNNQMYRYAEKKVKAILNS